MKTRPVVNAIGAADGFLSGEELDAWIEEIDTE